MANRAMDLNTTTLCTLLGAVLLIAACGPGPATTTEATTGSTADSTGATTGPDSTSEAPTPTSTSSTTTSEATKDASMTSGTTDASTTTGGECLVFEDEDPTDGRVSTQFTCGHEETLCPSDAALFSFESGPNWDDTASTDDLARVHCVLEALRDRTPGQVTYTLAWPVLGSDVGSLEIAGDFVIARREYANDFNYTYKEAVLWLEPSEVFAECRAKNTAAAAWLCMRPYINIIDALQPECVAGPLECG
ncbi:hypothetical protein OV203_17055 [Nannocystis sp. ILAH1]|uniref:hypothetical protein n=1 Tax=Nannocystis sp. ILAH1 TaxID=2996789 RepID=UPI00226F23A0|nr:hypothetical protein [Nannocystis sp. ILAH1]MCY0988848.1 hypothetical protein [Nannocystis sp. ILAH1]